MNDKTDVHFTMNVPKELRDAFLNSTRTNDTSAAQVLRAFMRDYIRKNSQGDLFKPTKKAA